MEAKIPKINLASTQPWYVDEFYDWEKEDMVEEEHREMKNTSRAQNMLSLSPGCKEWVLPRIWHGKHII